MSRILVAPIALAAALFGVDRVGAARWAGDTVTRDETVPSGVSLANVACR